MNNTQMSDLSMLLLEKWKKNIKKKDTQQQLNKIFSRKSIKNCVKDFSDFLNTTHEKKRKSLFTAIFVMALLNRNLDEAKEIQQYLKKYKLISLLYGGILILLKGTDPKFAIHISWSDNDFSNKYEFLSRFIGEFHYWDYIELFIAAKIIYEEDKEKFEQIIMQDRTRLLLLNICSFRLDIDIPTNWLISLMRNDQDELVQNIGFYLLTRKLTSTVRRLTEINNTKKSDERKKLSDEMQIEILRITDTLPQLGKNHQVSLPFNYVLWEKKWPQFFSTWLLSPDLLDIFAYEIKNKRKLRTLNDILCCLKIIETRAKPRQKLSPKQKLYSAVINVLTEFVIEGKGVHAWTPENELEFKEICKILPKYYKDRLKRHLHREKKHLLTSKIDELVRFQIHLKDKAKEVIICGMLAQL